MPDQPAADSTYVPATFVPPEKTEKIVDSLKGLDWHLAAQDLEVRAGIYDGTVTPVLASEFKAGAKRAKGTAPEKTTAAN